MPFVTPKPSGDFTPPPAGTHRAICYRLIDLGTQQSEFQGKVKRQHKIVVSWELPDEMMEGDEPKPFSIHQRYTFSLHEKAKLRADLESWRGKAFSEEELVGFDLENLLGKPCLVSIVHEPNDGKVYANVKSVSKLPKTMQAPSAPANVPTMFSLSSPDWGVFEKLSDSMKDTIKKSPEYAQATKPANMGDAPDNAPHNGSKPDLDDDIPF